MSSPAAGRGLGVFSSCSLISELATHTTTFCSKPILWSMMALPTGGQVIMPSEVRSGNEPGKVSYNRSLRLC